MPLTNDAASESTIGTICYVLMGLSTFAHLSLIKLHHSHSWAACDIDFYSVSKWNTSCSSSKDFLVEVNQKLNFTSHKYNVPHPFSPGSQKNHRNVGVSDVLMQHLCCKKLDPQILMQHRCCKISHPRPFI